MKLSRIILVSLIVLTGCARANNTDPQQEYLTKAINILDGESVIVGKYTCGFEEEKPTELAWAFSVIASSENAAEVFSNLAKSGSYYGLIGLKEIDPLRYRNELEAFAGSETVCVVECDLFIEHDAQEFVVKFLEEGENVLFERLRFAQIPKWQDTVKVVSPCSDSWFSEK